MKKLIVLLILIFALQTGLFTQNLVPDSSFEIKEGCPYKISELYKLKYWWSPTVATPDFFCNCEKGKWKNSAVEADNNFAGTQEPRSGNCYAGFISYQSKTKLYTEYIETKLTSILEKDKWYFISFYYSSADYCKFRIDSSLGVFLSKDSVFTVGYDKLRLKYKPQIKNKGPLKDDSKNWIQISGLYQAKGGEQFIVIGTFNMSKPKVRKHEEGSSSMYNQDYAYYYIDDVSVCEIKNTEEKKEIIIPVVKDLEVNKTYVLKNLNFETNSSVIQPSSFAELDSLISFLKQNPNLKIEISGHTDNTGDEKSNQKLSEDRAKAVAGYFIQKGIETKRITSAGYGNSKPVASNETAEGKAKNRRVEFIISN